MKINYEEMFDFIVKELDHNGFEIMDTFDFGRGRTAEKQKEITLKVFTNAFKKYFRNKKQKEDLVKALDTTGWRLEKEEK